MLSGSGAIESRVSNDPDQETSSLSRRRQTLPLRVRGSSGKNTMWVGQRDRVRCWRHQAFRSSSSGRASPRLTTAATTTSPHRSSGRPTTPAAPTPSWRPRTSSTSPGWTLVPPVTMTSSIRPTMRRIPSPSPLPQITCGVPAVLVQGQRGQVVARPRHHAAREERAPHGQPAVLRHPYVHPSQWPSHVVHPRGYLNRRSSGHLPPRLRHSPREGQRDARLAGPVSKALAGGGTSDQQAAE